MKRRDFIEALYAAGWRAPCDAQHTNIGKLWEKLFPTCAELELDLEEALEALRIEEQTGRGS